MSEDLKKLLAMGKARRTANITIHVFPEMREFVDSICARDKITITECVEKAVLNFYLQQGPRK